ncbi:MAG: FAD-dependent oxidoreductase [Cryobacterium sp.]|nr:FAD-dependent oxidoreductase [Oligoflexia bacterium]
MVRIAIIGSGISGVTSAFLLKKDHEVHLFEADDRLGGHTATKDITVASGTYPIDTGFIVFNDWTYPNFIRLLELGGVKWKDSKMSFSVKNERTGLEYNGDGLKKLFAQWRNLFRPSFYRMILEILRFNREAPKLLDDKMGKYGAEEIPLGRYLREEGYSETFQENYILAMGAAIWSASYDQMREFPARFFIKFFKNHGMLSVDERPIWKVIEGGSKSYLAPLLKGLHNQIHLSSPITSVTRSADGVQLEIGGSKKRSEKFDQVIFACHSDTVGRILKDPSPAESEIFSKMTYQPNDVILHTDTSLLPKLRSTWASWNYLVRKSAKSDAALTYHMNILQGIESPETFLVSLNLRDQIDPALILGSWTYDHPRFTLESVAAQARWSEISRIDLRTHFAGAYWASGFHEDGVNSALRVANCFEVKLA